ncbi:nibrin [Diabrotica virgifera virgifera]|uniref:Nibrin n=1 Tax=Diabrotica virgifera virgifera TaxID=50390 RepID=A0A6P7GWW4_DIAVI|nr:nibrin [Diabrotica virgifera virgifera]
MLYFLESINNDTAFYLISQNEFIVGRKKADILLEKDSSISKQHAKICISNDEVKITDLGSKYKTTVNGTELTPNVEVQLEDKYAIHFGGLGSKYIFRKMALVTTATQQSPTQKEALKKYLSYIQGKYVDTWNEECTHLTVEKISLTLKVLNALLEDKPTVEPGFWKKFAENVSNSLRPPDISAYNDPPLAQGLLNKVEFKNGIDRKNLFKDKIFLFTLEQEKKQVEELISKAGGSCVTWENECEAFKRIAASSKEFLVMQSRKDVDDKAYKDIIKLLSKQNRRTIPIQEIAMAIIHGSCEKDCNAEFNRVQQVFARTTNKEPTQHVLLAKNTQTQDSTAEPTSSKVIDETLDPDQPNVPPIQKRVVSVQEKDVETEKREIRPEKDHDTGKRLAADPDENNPFKKIKLDNRDNTKRSDGKGDAEFAKGKTSRFLSKKPITEKRKIIEDSDSDDSQPAKVTKKNPFSSITLTKKSNIENNPFASSRQLTGMSKLSSDNPLLRVTKKSNIEDNSLPSSTQLTGMSKLSSDNPLLSATKPIDNTPMLSCTKKEPQEPEYYPHITKVSDDGSGWYSKNNSVHVKKEKENEYDTELQDFVNLFKNKIVVGVLSGRSMRQPSSSDEVDCRAQTNGKNFKKFKKIKPLHPQITVIGNDFFNNSQFGNTTGIHDSRRRILYDSDDEQPSRKQRKTLKSFLI